MRGIRVQHCICVCVHALRALTFAANRFYSILRQQIVFLGEKNVLIYSSIAFAILRLRLRLRLCTLPVSASKDAEARARARLCISNENGKRDPLVISALLLTSRSCSCVAVDGTTSICCSRRCIRILIHNQNHNPQSRRARRSAGGRRTGRESARRRRRGRRQRCPTLP